MKVTVWRRTIANTLGSSPEEITVIEEYEEVKSVSETDDGFKIVMESKEQIWISKDYLEKVVIRK